LIGKFSSTIAAPYHFLNFLKLLTILDLKIYNLKIQFENQNLTKKNKSNIFQKKKYEIQNLKCILERIYTIQKYVREIQIRKYIPDKEVLFFIYILFYLNHFR